MEGRHIESDDSVPGYSCGGGYLPRTVKKCPVPECAVALVYPCDRVPTIRTVWDRMLKIRGYRTTDERSWLRCRLLSFFDTDYYDDVKISKTTFTNDHVELVADNGTGIVGLLDVEIDGDTATIDSIAVHPDAQREGIASKLLDELLRRIPEHVTSLDAWTRGTESANGWYASVGFSENQRYLHVYKDEASGDDGFETPVGLSRPVTAFMHARIELEDAVRDRFSRVHVCRQYLMEIQNKR